MERTAAGGGEEGSENDGGASDEDAYEIKSGEEEGNKVDGTKGDWTLQEGEEDLFVINNISGKKYKIALIPQNDGLNNKGDP